MDTLIEFLKRDISELRNHINFIEQAKTEIKSTSIIYEYSISRSKRKFEYNSIIISLYGLVETYIEKFCFEYIELIEKNIPKYSDLEQRFTDNHFKLSLDLANIIIGKKHLKYLHMEKETVICNLNH